jgi:hypothetical protein
MKCKFRRCKLRVKIDGSGLGIAKYVNKSNETAVFNYKVMTGYKFSLQFAVPNTDETVDDSKTLKQNIDANAQLKTGQISIEACQVRGEKINLNKKAVVKKSGLSTVAEVQNTNFFWVRPPLCTIVGAQEGPKKYSDTIFKKVRPEVVDREVISYQDPLVF